MNSLHLCNVLYVSSIDGIFRRKVEAGLKFIERILANTCLGQNVRLIVYTCRAERIYV